MKIMLNQKGSQVGPSTAPFANKTIFRALSKAPLLNRLPGNRIIGQSIHYRGPLLASEMRALPSG